MALPGWMVNLASTILKEELNKFREYDDNVKNLKEEIRNLKNARQKVDDRAREDEVRHGREIYDDVIKWLSKAQSIISEYEKFDADDNRIRTGCFVGLPLNVLAWYSLCQTAIRLKGEAATLLKDGKFDIISRSRGPPKVALALSNVDFQSFGSRRAAMEDIIKALKDFSARMIGVYGLSGVGKTTLVMEAVNRLQNDPKIPKLFDAVIMANLTRTPDIRKIQGQIADMLGMKLEEESEEGRASRIRERLKKEKESTLIILDDISATTVDLNILGIPWESVDGNQKNPKGEKSSGPKDPTKNNTKQQPSGLDAMLVQKGAGADTAVASTSSPTLTLEERYKGCKVLLISEVEQVLNQMEVKPLVHVDVLDENEANTLFNKMAGIGHKNSEFGELPALIVKRCDRLPMSIVTIAKALKNRTPSFWENTLKKLETQTVARTPEHSTRMIYDLLESEELQMTFLLCAFMGNDALISELVRLCIGLGFLDLQGIYTARDARTIVQIMLMKLRESHLLSNSYSSDRFTMQNLVRNAAFSITSKEKPMLMLIKRKIDEWPDDGELRRYVAISLRHCDLIEAITRRMACDKLKMLQVDNNDPHLKLPNEFFKQMEELKVLILTGVHLSPSGSSMKCLTKLRMLCLEHCTLIPSKEESSLSEELGVIENLKNLRILSFSGSNIDSLPVALGNLSKLQTLDISNCPKLSVIPPNLISRLTSLEELYMRKTPIQWPKVINGGENIKSEKASLSELGGLNQLTNLDIQIQSVDHLSENVFFDKVSSYKIVIGSKNRYLEKGFKMPEKHELSRFLAIHQKDGIPIHSHKGIKMLFERVEYLLLGKLTGVEDIFYDLNLKGFPHLKELAIRNNHHIEFLVKSPPVLGHQHPDEKAFAILETLDLYKVVKMKKICFSSRSLSKPSFENLKTIKINCCENLQCLFSISMLELLTALETIQASDCGSLQNIVEEITDGDGSNNELKLRTLTLQSLPEFIGFDPKSPTEATRILFHEKVDLSTLERLELRSIQIQKIWNDRSSNFENLIHLDVSGCHNLTYLLPFSLARNLKKLQSLYVTECDQMKNIFLFPDGPIKVAKDVSFPNLKNIKLSSMSSLTKIWNLDDPRRAVGMFEKLETLVIENCKKLVSVFDHEMKGMFQGLSRLKVTNCGSMKTIFNLADDQNQTKLKDVHLESLPKLENIFKGILQLKFLQNMSVHDCEMLENIFPFSVAADRRLEKLQCLVVSDCSELKGIVAAPRDTSRENNRAIEPDKLEFPELTSIKVSNLPKFENFCPGHCEMKCEKLDDVSIKSCGKHKLFREEANQATTSATNEEEATTSARNGEEATASATNQATTSATNGEEASTSATVGEANRSAQRKPLFLEEVLNQLKSMHIESQHISSSFTHYRLDKLEVLGLSKLGNTMILYNFLHSSPNLNSLWLDSCYFEKLVEPENKSSYDGIGIKGVVPKLKTLKLTNLYFLEEIGFEHDPILQRIESLVIENCPSLETVVPSKESVCFTFLTKLEVVDCKRMKYLMPLSTAKSLGQLVTMKVTNCKSLEEIIIVSDHQTGEESEKEPKIVFKQMQALELASLKNLTSFCSSKNFTLEFPLLEKFVASACPKLKKFSGKDIKTTPTILQKVYFVPDEEKRLCWEGDLPATIDHIYENQKYFEGMDKISVSEHSVLEERWKSEKDVNKGWFYSLKILTLEGCKFESCAIPWFILRYSNSLKELKVRKCINITSIFEKMDENAIIKGTFQLERLTLEELANVTHVWPQQDKRKDSCFPNLQQVTVKFCRKLKTLFPVAIATDLKKLEQLEVCDCDELLKIVEKGEGGDTELSCVLSCLVQLEFYNLPQLTHFYDGNFTLECPKLNTLQLFNCNKFELFHHKTTPEEINSESENRTSIVRPSSTNIKDISKVEAMSLRSKDTSVLNLWLQESESHELEYLRTLILDFGDDVNYEYSTLPSGILERTHKLENIIIINSTSLKKMLFLTQNSSNGQDKFLEHLEGLVLFSLFKLRTIRLGSLSKLRHLYLYHCPLLKTIEQYPSTLKELNVESCNGLQYLFTSSAAGTLKHLEELDVKDCKSLEDIVRDDGTATEENIFERLESINLQNLESLECFYSGNDASKLPTLDQARIWKCPKMTIFSQQLIDVKFSIPVNPEEGTQFSNQASLVVNDFPELQVKWVSSSEIQLHRSFSFLKSLEVEGCEFLTNAVLPSHLLPLLSNLEELTVKKCKHVEAIFDVKDAPPEHDDPVTFHLNIIVLEELPTLKHVWNNDPREASLSFPSLKKVFVKECKSIKRLFHSSVPRDNLEHLDVRNCGELVEIVGKDEAFIAFPKLAWLVLRDLPKLRCICYGMQSLLDCSAALTRLYVYRCPLLKVFAANSQNSNQGGEDSSATDDGKEGFVSSTKRANFEELELSKEDVRMIEKGLLDVDLQYLNYLGLNNFNDDESDEFPDALLSKLSLPKLTEIQLVDCALKDIFCSKGSDIDYSKMLSQLKYLEIINLYNLNSMGFEHPWMVPLLESLQTLRISECNSLTNLAASHVVCSFSLTELTVDNCAGLKYLFTSSTAKSLGALQKLSITKCKSLKTIIMSHEEGDKAEDILSFKKLGTLSLNELPQLESFYTGDSTLYFSNICYDSFTITKCNKMKTFSGGDVLPKFLHGKIDEDPWYGDLNSAVEEHYVKTKATAPVTYMDLPLADQRSLLLFSFIMLAQSAKGTPKKKQRRTLELPGPPEYNENTSG
ncbi:hypothetical protein PIB30_049938 [Stylosanthes scabra]|uniref:AAA+ ATPase domain-containing protein n=1 Tax=Stylosanthes scabra TaxID=79078 RepID=A0ABU6SHA9_9FABA|nr:hypothetical protein [Stylosanthes scabra]